MFYRPVFCSRGLTKKAARKTWLAGMRPGHDGGIILELSGLPAMQGIATGGPFTGRARSFFWTPFRDFSAVGRTAPSSTR